MATNYRARRWQRFFIVSGGAALIVAMLYFAREVLVPVALAILIAFILRPMVTVVQRRGLGRIPSVLLVTSLAGLLVVATSLAVLYQLKSLAEELPQQKTVILEKIKGLHESSNSPWLANASATVGEILGQLRGPESDEGVIPVRVESGDPWARMMPVVGPALDVLVNAGVVAILVIFMLIQREDLRNRLLRLSGNRSITSMTRVLDDSSQRISRFLMMQFVVNGTYGLAFGLGLFAIGVPYAILWGVLAGVLRYIPYIGAWIAAAFPMVLSVAVFPTWFPFLGVSALILVLELLSNNWMEPWLYGRSTGVNELALLVAAMFWTWLWGPVGLAMATPLTTCLVVLGRYVPHLEFLSVLLGDDAPLEPPVVYFQRLLARDQDEAAELVDDYLETHKPAELFDDVFVPALAAARMQHQRGEISKADVHFANHATGEIIDEVLASAPPPTADANATAPPPDDALPLVIGCAARDEMEVLTLRMLEGLLGEHVCKLEVLGSIKVSGEVIQRVKEERPAVVCITAMPPGGLAPTRYLCKRLRHAMPEVRIIVGYFGNEANLPRVRQRLTQSGANVVAGSIQELRDELKSMVKLETPDKTRQLAATV